MRRLILDPAKTFRVPIFLPHLVLGYHGVYGRVMDPRDVFIPVLMEDRGKGNLVDWADGHLNILEASGRITERLGRSSVSLRSMLRDDWVDRNLVDAAFHGSELEKTLAENDVAKGWTPTRPLLLVSLPNDDLVPNENNLAAQRTLAERIGRSGGDPAKVLVMKELCVPDLGGTHLEGLVVAIPMALNWFDKGMPR
jgi:hypothetical protein